MIKFYYGDYVKFYNANGDVIADWSPTGDFTYKQLKDHAPNKAVKAIVFHVFDEPAPLFIAEVSLINKKFERKR